MTRPLIHSTALLALAFTLSQSARGVGPTGQDGTPFVRSLNLATAVAIGGYEAFRQLSGPATGPRASE
jgi:hypothetical protein